MEEKKHHALNRPIRGAQSSARETSAAQSSVGLNADERYMVDMLVERVRAYMECGLCKRAAAIRNILVDASTGAAILEGVTSVRFRDYQRAITEIDAILGE